MNDIRRRKNATSSAASSPSSSSSNGGGVKSSSQRKNNDNKHNTKSQRFNGELDRLVKRKGKTISRVKQICSKIGQLRIVDVVLCIGVVAKICSMIYNSHVSVHAPTPLQQQQTHSIIISESADESGKVEIEPMNNKWLQPKWLKRWSDHKMPFNAPLLYRREDDDYSYGYDIDDDDNDNTPSKPSKIIRFKGIFLRDSHYDEYKDHMHQYGYAVVDDMLYTMDERREYTEWALEESDFEVDFESSWDDHDYDEEPVPPAFDLRIDVDLAHHHFTDDHYWDYYYSVDDDEIRGTLGIGIGTDRDDDYHDEEDIRREAALPKDVCIRTSFARLYRPTCNEFHANVNGYDWLIDNDIHSRRWKKKKQQTSITSRSKFLGHGYYRDAFLFGQQSALDDVVFKTMRHMYRSEREDTIADDDDIVTRGLGFDPKDRYHEYNYKDEMRKDAMVMELLSSSPWAINIYAHCAMSSITEFAPVAIDDYIMPTSGYSPKKLLRRGAENANENEDEPLNDHISPEEKLEIALEMAKCLAAMHGFKGGVIAHGDIQVGQFFKGRDGLVKLVDYNRAEPVLYDPKNERYCKWRNDMPPDGTARAPEENRNALMSEAIDVYSLGNVFYSLLTGKIIFGDLNSVTLAMQRIATGNTLEIPESYSELPSSKLLVEAIGLCWTYDDLQRPSIFEVLKFLERAVKRYPWNSQAN